MSDGQCSCIAAHSIVLGMWGSIDPRSKSMLKLMAWDEREQNKLNRLTYGTNFRQDHTRYPTSAQCYFQTSGGFPGSGLLGGWSGGQPGKNLVIRCCVACIRCVVRGTTLSLSGGRPGIRSTVCWSVGCVGILGSSVSCNGVWSASRGWSAESCRLDFGKKLWMVVWDCPYFSMFALAVRTRLSHRLLTERRLRRSLSRLLEQ